ncbi:MAG: pentapeptide repeat-containing protein, partial [Cyanobacteria bacterium P01_A01_bin.135]
MTPDPNSQPQAFTEDDMDVSVGDRQAQAPHQKLTDSPSTSDVTNGAAISVAGNGQGQVEAVEAKDSLPVSSTSFSPVQSSQPTTPAAPARAAAPPGSLIVLIAVGIMLTGISFGTPWLVVTGAAVALLVSLRMSWVVLQPMLAELISPQQRSLTVAIIGIVAAVIGLLQAVGAGSWLNAQFGQLNWDAVGAIGDLFGALGQILIAILAVYVAWRQYVISKDLTIQQNLITQQQTIDSYFQGISDLVLDAEGLLEDWPQERAIAEGRTAAILSSVDATGKAKIVRFLSRSRLLTPLRRDRHLGRAMLDGMGGYQEDRDYGIRVIDLGVMLAAANLVGTDLRWTDISDANLVRAIMIRCDLVKANLARTILYEADLREADMMGARLFYGDLETATPRSRTQPPDYQTGECTGAVVENANFGGVKRLSDKQRQYICAWSGDSSR